MRKGQIIKLIGGLYELIDVESKAIIQAKASGKLRYQKLDESSSFNKSVTKKTKLETKIVQFST